MRPSLLDPRATASVLEDVREERAGQDNRWGQQNHSPARWLAILTEKVGQAAHEANELEFRDAGAHRAALLRRELVQVAAVAVAWVEAIDRASRCSAGTWGSSATPLPDCAGGNPAQERIHLAQTFVEGRVRKTDPEVRCGLDSAMVESTDDTSLVTCPACKEALGR